MASQIRRAFGALLALVGLTTSTAWADEGFAVRDPVDQIRRALEEKRARAPDGSGSDVLVPVGLSGERAESQGDLDGALRMYGPLQGGGDIVAAAATLRSARLWAKQGRPAEAAASYVAVLRAPLLGQDPSLLDEASAAIADSGQLLAAVSPGQLTRKAPEDALGRAAYARFLSRVATAPAPPADIDDQRRRAARRLVEEFPETESAQALPTEVLARSVPDFGARPAALRRARVLEGRHAHARLHDTLKPHRPAKGDTSEEACEIRYLLGRTARKMRRYREARQYLGETVERCGEPWKKKARYLTAQIASFGKPDAAIAAADPFLAAYPSDSLTDDVLLWKAEAFERAEKWPESAAAYQQIVERFPNGDMHDKARFGLAWLLIRQGEVQKAGALLDQIARTSSKSPAIVRDQALYWRARLLAFPRWDAFEANVDLAERAAGFAALTELAKARPASFYGHLAHQLTQSPVFATERAQAGGQGEAPALGKVRRDLDESGQLTPSPALLTQPAFPPALRLLEAGFDEEAALLLDQVERRPLSSSDRLLLTLAYARARARHKSHQVLRSSGFALPEGKPAAASLLLWNLSFPRAHEQALAEATARFSLPSMLLFALAREESAFEAEVVSWAGAIGLCQLMPFTAKEEAERNHLPLSSMDALQDPTLNATLGASHLARRMRLGHPLLAIAAYNAGPGNVNKWRKAFPITPIDAFVESIPVEQTRNYVKKVTGSWVVYSVLDASRDEVVFPMTLPR